MRSPPEDALRPRSGSLISACEDPSTSSGSCGDCDARGGYGIFVDRDIGTFELNEGDQITLCARTDFACGIDGDGADAAYENITEQRL